MCRCRIYVRFVVQFSIWKPFTKAIRRYALIPRLTSPRSTVTVRRWRATGQAAHRLPRPARRRYTCPYTRNVTAGSWPTHLAVADGVVPPSSSIVAAVCLTSCSRITGTAAVTQ
jgi:hypothetical protein